MRSCVTSTQSLTPTSLPAAPLSSSKPSNTRIVPLPDLSVAPCAAKLFRGANGPLEQIYQEETSWRAPGGRVSLSQPRVRHAPETSFGRNRNGFVPHQGADR